MSAFIWLLVGLLLYNIVSEIRETRKRARKRQERVEQQRIEWEAELIRYPALRDVMEYGRMLRRHQTVFTQGRLAERYVRRNTESPSRVPWQKEGF